MGPGFLKEIIGFNKESCPRAAPGSNTLRGEIWTQASLRKLKGTWLGVCVLVWAFPCGLMLLLHLVELAFGQLFFSHTRLGVCVLVWAFPCSLMLLLHLVELAFGQLFF